MLYAHCLWLKANPTPGCADTMVGLIVILIIVGVVILLVSNIFSFFLGGGRGGFFILFLFCFGEIFLIMFIHFDFGLILFYLSLRLRSLFVKTDWVCHVWCNI